MTSKVCINKHVYIKNGFNLLDVLDINEENEMLTKPKWKWNKWEEETQMLAWGAPFVIQKPEMFLILIILAKFIICQILK